MNISELLQKKEKKYDRELFESDVNSYGSKTIMREIYKAL